MGMRAAMARQSLCCSTIRHRNLTGWRIHVCNTPAQSLVWLEKDFYRATVRTVWYHLAPHADTEDDVDF